ncbi:JAB domain-containing protein [Acinetobacter sp.]|uniref:JAB domain-containing protein n=1 Tax=Acinetobacter sp. TaxID=472 RepID=UPI003D0016B3
MIINEYNGSKANAPKLISKIFTSILLAEEPADRDKEHFWAIGLTASYTIKYIDLVSLGILNEALVHPREVFRTAINNGVHGIVVVHNHPSGETMASSADKDITEKLVEAGDIIGIKVWDHIIVTLSDKYSSFQENGIIKDGIFIKEDY